jgi:hypothetical protein
LQQIIDRRLAGKNKSIGNRERFLRRHKDQIRDGRRAVDGAASATWNGRGHHIPRATSPSRCSATAGGKREWCTRIRTTSGDRIKARAVAAAAGRQASDRRGHDDSSSTSAEEFAGLLRRPRRPTWCARNWPDAGVKSAPASPRRHPTS